MPRVVTILKEFQDEFAYTYGLIFDVTGFQPDQTWPELPDQTPELEFLIGVLNVTVKLLDDDTFKVIKCVPEIEIRPSFRVAEWLEVSQ